MDGFDGVNAMSNAESQLEESDSSHQNCIDRTTFLSEMKALEKRLESKIGKRNNRGEDSTSNSIRSFQEIAGEVKAFFSIRGYSKLLGTDSLFKKVFWLITGTILLSAGVFHVIQNVEEYSMHGVITQITIKKVEQLLFPAVSFCILKYEPNAYYDTFEQIVLDEVLTSCEFSDKKNSECSVDDFYNFQVAMSLDNKSLTWSCYQINGGRDAANQEKGPFVSTQFGVGTGLNLGLDLEPFYFVQYFVGDTKVIPIFTEIVKILQPGRDAFVSIRKTVDTKLPKPYSVCTEEINENTSDWVKTILQQNLTYRQDYCYEAQRYPQYVEKYNNSACPLECETVSFDVSESILSSSEGNDSRHLDVNFFFENDKVTEVSQSVKTSETDLVSNIGGVLGIFLGVSFVSVYILLNSLFDLLL